MSATGARRSETTASANAGAEAGATVDATADPKPELAAHPIAWLLDQSRAPSRGEVGIGAARAWAGW